MYNKTAVEKNKWIRFIQQPDRFLMNEHQCKRRYLSGGKLVSLLKTVMK